MDELADYLHEELCTRNKPCAWYSGEDSPHRGFYELRAKMLMEKLAPEIGSANVLPTVRVVIEELW